MTAATLERPRPLAYRPRTMPTGGQTATDTREDRSQALLDGLRQGGPPREAAIAELHALLVRGALHELHRHRERGQLDPVDLQDLATQAADDATVSILRRLDSFRGESRFTTWAYKFVLLEAGVKARRRSWQGREVTLEDESWRALASAAAGPGDSAAQSELLRAIAAAMETELSTRQREILTALAIDGVPIDVLAERTGNTRGALYKTLHDARRKLRAALARAGHELEDETIGGPR